MTFESCRPSSSRPCPLVNLSVRDFAKGLQMLDVRPKSFNSFCFSHSVSPSYSAPNWVHVPTHNDSSSRTGELPVSAEVELVSLLLCGIIGVRSISYGGGGHVNYDDVRQLTSGGNGFSHFRRLVISPHSFFPLCDFLSLHSISFLSLILSSGVSLWQSIILR